MHKFKKSLGQNFLRDNTILDKIVNEFNVGKNSVILEVGPGDGALTKKLLIKKTDVISFEIDESLKVYLDKISDNKLRIIYGDFLKENINNYIKKYDQIFFVSNVPYYITTPIINKLIDCNVIPNTMILMVQKEVGKRLSAKEHNSEYGAISVLLNYYFNIEYLFDVDKSAFYPMPKVNSAVVKFEKKDNLLELKDYQKYKKIVFDAFKQKRKNIKNNLKNYDLEIINNILKKHNLDLTNRAEDLSYEVFVEIANNL